MPRKIHSYRDINVFNSPMEASMVIFQLSKHFPPEEKYSLTDQIRRSSRSVCANMSEACAKGVEFGCSLQMLIEKDKLMSKNERIIGQIVNMIRTADKWVMPVKI